MVLCDLQESSKRSSVGRIVNDFIIRFLKVSF